MTNRKRTNRKPKWNANLPKWAKRIHRNDWRHLQGGQGKSRPTMESLRTDAATCPDCARIARALELRP